MNQAKVIKLLGISVEVWISYLAMWDKSSALFMNGVFKAFCQKERAQQHRKKHFVMDFLHQAAPINLFGVKDEPGRLPPFAAVAVCRPQSLPEAKTERGGKKKPSGFVDWWRKPSAQRMLQPVSSAILCQGCATSAADGANQ